MDWEFFGVMMTLAGSGTVLMLAGAVARRIAHRPERDRVDSGDRTNPVAEERLLAALSNVEERMANLEERFEFNERLLQGRTEGQVTPPKADTGG